MNHSKFRAGIPLRFKRLPCGTDEEPLTATPHGAKAVEIACSAFTISLIRDMPDLSGRFHTTAAFAEGCESGLTENIRTPI
jgi:hypothetical protein